MLNMAELLIHSDDVPQAARVALASAVSGPDSHRTNKLVEAARILHFDGGLDCADACELVGLGDDCGCEPGAQGD
ncbi:MAG TPA: hypothetical protein VIV11_41165 [Kofleriaceae bacterium]